MTTESNSEFEEASSPESGRKPWLSEHAYVTLKWLNRCILPGTAALYFLLVEVWGFSNGLQVIGAIAVMNTLLGALETLAERSYDQSDAKYDGDLEIIEHPDGIHTYLLSLNSYPEHLAEKNRIIFKVNTKTDKEQGVPE